MGYNDASKKSTMKYIKEKQQEIKVRYKKDGYENDILPVIEQSGLPVLQRVQYHYVHSKAPVLNKK